ncbi:hypothetical protein JOQ06_026096, partial [Pogonophryne albipinna]
FLVCMVIGSLIMLRGGIPVATVRPMLADILEQKLRTALPLDTASREDRNMAESVQQEVTHTHTHTHTQGCIVVRRRSR